MSTISFGGLATGLETEKIIKGLMDVERRPLQQLEDKKTIQQARLESYKAFDQKLDSVQSAVKELSYSADIRQNEVSLSNSSYFTASASGAQEGSYAVSVEQLAQNQKSVSSSAYASKTDSTFGSGTINLKVGAGVVSSGAAGTDYSISIDNSNNSLQGVRDAINAGTDDHGVSARIIDNGNEGGDRYYLVLNGADSKDEFTLDASGLSGGDTLALDAPVQQAQSAQATIDGIQVTSATNTIENAISGVKLNLTQKSNGDTVQMDIAADTGSVVSKVENFVKTYNDMMDFVMSQSKTGDSQGGALLGDRALNSVKLGLQRMISSNVEGQGTYSSLVELGLSTQRDGTLEFDAGKLQEAMGDDFNSVVNVLAGNDDNQGAFKQMRTYLNDMLSPSSGVLATHEKTINSRIDDIDEQINSMEDRLDKRKQTLESEFAALGSTVAEMNKTSQFLSQQLGGGSAFSSMMGG